MSPPPRVPAAEFLALTEKYLAGDISGPELARWEAMCLSDSTTFDYYLSLARTEALLPAAVERLNAESARGRVVPFFRRIVFLRGLAAAAALVVTGVFVTTIVRRAGPAGGVTANGSGAVPAQVTASYGVRWTEGAAENGARLTRASGAFSSGLLELTLDSGVRLLVQGPAAYTVTGRNAVRLENGRAVADVPLPARGFTLTSPRDRIVDHGTRFAVDVSADGAETMLGVLSGEVELFNGDRDVRLFTDYAVKRNGESIVSVPFDRSRFITEAPAREFSWSLDGDRHDTMRRLEFDVTNLVHGAGDYRAVVRWLLGFDAVSVKSFTLERDGVAVARAGEARSGDPNLTGANAPVLHIAAGDYRVGKWMLVVEAYAEGRLVARPRPVKSSGVVSFEEGLSLTADAKRFLGKWHYSHDGVDCEREFLADGTARYFIRGKSTKEFDGAHWSVDGGVLSLVFDRPVRITETHMLRDDRTMIFLNRPYRAAQKE